MVGIMPFLGEDPLRPAARPLVALDSNIPSDLLEVLRLHGIASNDAALGVLDAESQFARAADALDRHAADTDAGNVLGWTIDATHAACLDHLERMIVIYARAAVSYVTLAVEIASAVADGRPPAPFGSLPPLPSEVLAMWSLHVPRLQLPASAARERLTPLNDELARTHECVVQALQTLDSDAKAFDDPDPVQMSTRRVGYILEVDVPASLHGYAVACVAAIAFMYAADAQPG
ncbi:hypothetical protein GCM10018962_15360 [Dactylosporangium matsuzakiense]